MILFAAFSLAQIVHAESVRGIHAKTTQPIAPRGGVLMLPLTAERHGTDWPASMKLAAAKGDAIHGQVAWVLATPEKFQRHWTDDPRDLAIRPIQSSDDSSQIEPDGVLGPYLLVNLPERADGELRLGNQVLRPVWRNLPRSDPLKPEEPRDGEDTRQALELTPAHDRPDPVSPFEYWRWVLLADALDLKPPAPFGGDIERMAAQHYADLWRIGMARLVRKSAPIARECRDLLTKTCIDRRQPFAAWVADPAQVGSLLSSLIDFQRTDDDALADAVAWIDRQPSLFLWPEAEGIDSVRLTMVATRTEPLPAKFKWRNSGEPAMEVQIEPGLLTQVSISRPAAPKPGAPRMPMAPEPVRQILQVETGGRQHEFAFGPRVAVARPPGVFFRPLSPPLTLAEAQTSMQRVGSSNQSTLVQVRRLSGRWEVFYECRRSPSAQPPASGADQNVLENVRSYDELRGIEAATLLLGPEDADGGPAVWITVPERGFPRVLRGAHDGTLQMHRKSHGDRWYCRIVLPESWFSDEVPGPALIGCLRSHADSNQLETGPNTTAPWRAIPSRAAIDLHRWDDLPKAE